MLLVLISAHSAGPVRVCHHAPQPQSSATARLLDPTRPSSTYIIMDDDSRSSLEHPPTHVSTSAAATSLRVDTPAAPARKGSAPPSVASNLTGDSRFTGSPSRWSADTSDVKAMRRNLLARKAKNAGGALLRRGTPPLPLPVVTRANSDEAHWQGDEDRDRGPEEVTVELQLELEQQGDLIREIATALNAPVEDDELEGEGAREERGTAAGMLRRLEPARARGRVTGMRRSHTVDMVPIQQGQFYQPPSTFIPQFLNPTSHVQINLEPPQTAILSAKAAAHEAGDERASTGSELGYLVPSPLSNGRLANPYSPGFQPKPVHRTAPSPLRAMTAPVDTVTAVGGGSFASAWRESMEQARLGGWSGGHPGASG